MGATTAAIQTSRRPPAFACFGEAGRAAATEELFVAKSCGEAKRYHHANMTHTSKVPAPPITMPRAEDETKARLQGFSSGGSG